MKSRHGKGFQACLLNISKQMDIKRNTIQRQLIFNAVKELDVRSAIEKMTRRSLCWRHADNPDALFAVIRQYET